MSIAKDRINEALEKGAETTTYIKSYIENQLEITRFEMANGYSKAVTRLVTMAVAGLFGSMIVFFLFIALGFYLADKFGSNTYGFMAVAGIILLSFVLFYLLRKFIVTKPAQKQADDMFFKDGKREDVNIDELKERGDALKSMINKSAQELPNSLQDIKMTDFLPENISSIAQSGIAKQATKLAQKTLTGTTSSKNENGDLKQFIIKQAFKWLRKKMS